jgi:hypothetical protein
VAPSEAFMVVATSSGVRGAIYVIGRSYNTAIESAVRLLASITSVFHEARQFAGKFATFSFSFRGVSFHQ